MHLPTSFHQLRWIVSLALVGIFWCATSTIAQAVTTSFSLDNLNVGSPKIAGVPFDITITALDENGDVDLGYTGIANIIDETGTLYPTQTGNFTQGVWRGTVYITKASTADHITASFNSIVGQSDALTINPDSRMGFLSISAGNAQTQTVGTQLPIALRAKVSDPYSNPIPGQGVNFSVISIPTNAANYSITNNSQSSDANGYVSTTFTLGTKAGIYLIAANLTSGFQHTVTFSETAVPSNLISLSINPSITIVPSGTHMPFAAVGYDLYYNQITPIAVTWSVQNGGGTIDTAGVFTAGTSLGSFSNTIKAVSGTVGSTASVSIVNVQTGSASIENINTGLTSSASATPTPVTGVLYNVQVEPEVLSLLRSLSIPIVAQGTDYYGNPVSGVSYDFGTTGDLGTVTQTGPNSAVITGSDAGVGTVTVTATQGNITRTANIAGSVGSGLNRRLVIEDIASPQRVGEPFTISVAAKDMQNNFITTYNGPLVLADTTGTIDPAVVQPSENGIWYIQAIINASNPEVSITVAGDGMVGVSNVFEVTGDPKKSQLGFGGSGGGFADVLGASVSAKINELMIGQNMDKYVVVRYIGAGLAAGFGILGASIGGGIMASKGLEAIGRNPFAKGRLQANLYVSLIVFVIAASLAVFASTIIIK